MAGKSYVERNAEDIYVLSIYKGFFGVALLFSLISLMLGWIGLVFTIAYLGFVAYFFIQEARINSRYKELFFQSFLKDGMLVIAISIFSLMLYYSNSILFFISILVLLFSSFILIRVALKDMRTSYSLDSILSISANKNKYIFIYYVIVWIVLITLSAIISYNMNNWLILILYFLLFLLVLFFELKAKSNFSIFGGMTK